MRLRATPPPYKVPLKILVFMIRSLGVTCGPLPFMQQAISIRNVYFCYKILDIFIYNCYIWGVVKRKGYTMFRLIIIINFLFAIGTHNDSTLSLVAVIFASIAFTLCIVNEVFDYLINR